MVALTSLKTQHLGFQTNHWYMRKWKERIRRRKKERRKERLVDMINNRYLLPLTFLCDQRNGHRSAQSTKCIFISRHYIITYLFVTNRNFNFFLQFIVFLFVVQCFNWNILPVFCRRLSLCGIQSRNLKTLRSRSMNHFKKQSLS